MAKTPPVAPISDSQFDYQSEIETIKDHSGNQFLKLRPCHIRALKGNGDAAVVLAYLINLLFLKDANPKDREQLEQDELWFRCPAKDIETTLGMFSGKRQRAIKTLTKKRYVETDYRTKKVLWIRVRSSKLRWAHKKYGQKSQNSLSEKLKQLNRKSQNSFSDRGANLAETQEITERNGQADSPLRTFTKKNTKNPRPLTRDGRPTPSNRLVSVCHRYHDKLTTEKKIIRTTTPLKQWPLLALKFVKTLPDGEDQFVRVVGWYIANFGKPYIPEAFSMKSLLKDQGDKFFRIEARMNRPDWSKRKDPNNLRDDEQP